MSRNRGVLKKYLLSFLLILIMPMSVLFAYMTYAMRRNAVSEQIEENRSELELVYAMVQDDLEQFEPTALLALDNPSLRPTLLGQSFYNYYKAVEILKQTVRSNGLMEMAIVYDRLNDIAVSNYGTTPLTYFGEQVWHTVLDIGIPLNDYIEMLEGPAYAFGDVMLTGIGVQRCVLYFCPSKITQQADDAVFIIVMPVENIPRLFAKRAQTRNNCFYLFDGEDRLIVSYGQNDSALQQLALEAGTRECVIRHQSNEYCITVQRNEDSGWRYVSILSLTKANEAVARRMGLFSFLFAVLLALGGTGLYFAIRWSYYPLLRLSNQAQSLVQEPELNEEETIRKAMDTLQERLWEAEQHIVAVQPAARGYMVQQATLGKSLDDFIYTHYSQVSVDSLRDKYFTVAALSISECNEPEVLCERLRAKNMTVYMINEMTKDMLLLIIETELRSMHELTRIMNEALHGYPCGVITLGGLSRFDNLHRSCFEAELGMMMNGTEQKGLRILPTQNLSHSMPLLPPQFCAGMIASLHEILCRGDAAALAEFPERWKNALDKVELPRMEYALLSYELFWTIISAFSGTQHEKALFQKMLDYFYAISPVTSKERLADAAAFFCSNAFCFLSRKGDDKRERLMEILAYIDAHCSDSSFTIQSVADAFHVTLSWLSRFFKEQMHMTVMEYARGKRIEYIKRLILESDLPMSEIAGKMGYSSASSFIRFFKSECGMTPMQYKEQKKQEQKDGKIPD